MTIGAVRAIALASGLVLCAGSVSAAQERKAVAGSDLDRAQAAFQAGRYTEALALARRGADTAPTSVRALTVRAGMAEFLGEFEEARTIYDRASALAPDDAELIYRTASFAVRVGEYDRALAQLDRLLALHPAHVRWLFQWAPTYLQPGLLRDHPSLEQIVQIKLDILTEKGDLAQARQLARSYAIVKSGENYCSEAQATSREGAEPLFDETIRLSPTFARPYNYRATIAAHLGDREAALAWLQRGLQADPDSWRTHRNLGKLLSDFERYPEAEMHLRKTVQLFGDDAGGRLALARVLYAQGKYDDFAREARAAVALLANWKAPVPEVRDFLAKFDRWGPGAALPPAPDPPVIVGWNYD